MTQSIEPVSGETIDYPTLRTANEARQLEWDEDNQITLAYRGNEFAGEAGEVCNVIKKLERERMGIRGSRDTVEHLAEELADTVICADLIAMQAGIDLDAAVAYKFNATSEKVGLPQRLRTLSAAHGEAVAWRADHEIDGEYTRRFTASEWEAYQWSEAGLNVEGLALIDPFTSNRKADLADMAAYVRQRDDAIADLEIAEARLRDLQTKAQEQGVSDGNLISRLHPLYGDTRKRLDDFEEGHAKGYSDAIADAATGKVKGAHIAFLEEAARYFEKRDNGGEDAAFWANVANAETCRAIAAALSPASLPLGVKGLSWGDLLAGYQRICAEHGIEPTSTDVLAALARHDAGEPVEPPKPFCYTASLNLGPYPTIASYFAQSIYTVPLYLSALKPIEPERISEDDMAAVLWRTELVDAGVPQSAVDGRTRSAFDLESESTKNRWRKFARAALNGAVK